MTKKITTLAEWQALTNHQKSLSNQKMQDWFTEDAVRFSRFSLAVADILLDYSKNRLNDDTLKLLNNLANAAKLPEKINDLFSGKSINTTENRAALHTALRDRQTKTLIVNGTNIMPEIHATWEKIRFFSEKIRTQQWLGATQKPIRDIVNIGIGGSHLGPCMATLALSDFTTSNLRCHYISNIDGAHLQQVLREIDPERTLFIVSSKSFNTIETLTNAHTLKAWLQSQLNTNDVSQHFVAVTSAKERAIQFGITEENIFPLWDWVGGRYSVWSAIGLPLILMIGMDAFMEFLDGAHAMDKHFRETPFLKNMPVLLGLISVWYTNFFSAKTHAVVPYSHALDFFPAFLQQLEMESNGKTITHTAEETDYATGQIVWGHQGINGQHAFYQLFHQGNHFIPVDFILVGQGRDWKHQDILIASGVSQAQALMRGKPYDQALAELLSKGIAEEKARTLATHKTISGNRPSNTLFLKKITPYNLGMLLALYEHKVFVQGVIWDINSFDQWGVELGKELLPNILADFSNAGIETEYDGSTLGLIGYYKTLRKSYE